MRKQTFIERIINRLKSLFTGKKKAQENSDEIKREMCKKAVQAGVCPHACDRCAWGDWK